MGESVFSQSDEQVFVKAWDFITVCQVQMLLEKPKMKLSIKAGIYSSARTADDR